MDPEVQEVLDDIVELGYVSIRDGKIDVATPPKNNLCHYRWDRWTPTLQYLRDYATHHEDFGGDFFVCLYDGWREYSMPSYTKQYIPWSHVEKSRYLGHGRAGEPRFLHRDNSHKFPELPLKVLTYNAHVGDRNAIVIPDAEFIESQYAKFITDVKQHDMSWDAKQPIMFWRGSQNLTNGSEYTYLNIDCHPRHFITRQYITGVDASFASAPIASFLKHKYLLDIDGMVNAWSGLYWKLMSNSLVLKHSSHWYQWYYPLLKPWVHYVPIESFQTLPNLYEWCKNNDATCQQIAKNASALVSQLTYEYATRDFVFCP